MKPISFTPLGGSEYTLSTMYDWAWEANPQAQTAYFNSPGVHGEYPLSGRVLSRRRTGTLTFTLLLGNTSTYDSSIDTVLTNFKYAGYLKLKMTDGTHRRIYFSPEDIKIDTTRKKLGLASFAITGHAGAFYQSLTGLTASKTASTSTTFSLDVIDTGNVDITLGLSVSIECNSTALTAFTISNVTLGVYFSYAGTPNIASGQSVIVNITAGTALYTGSINVRHRISVPANQIPIFKLKGGVTNSIEVTTTPASNVTLLLAWAPLWL